MLAGQRRANITTSSNAACAPCPSHVRHRARQPVAASSSSSSSRKRKPSPVSQALVTVLKDELKVEKERYRTPEAVLDGPPNGFELSDRPNSTMLLLMRRYGDEDIFVEVDIDSQQEGGAAQDAAMEDEEDDEDSDALPPVIFSVTISKDDKTMAFSCAADGDSIAIRHVSLTDAEDEEDEDEDELEFPAYTGPVFEELDDTLQQAFADYLEERGITAAFGLYLMELLHDKLEVEYMNWLQRARDFVSSP